MIINATKFYNMPLSFIKLYLLISKMIGTKTVRYIVYFLLGIIVIWSLNEMLSSYYSMKADISFQNLKKSIKEQNQKNKDDSIFYVKIDSLLSLKKYDDAIGGLEKRAKLFPREKSIFMVQIGNIYKLKGDLNLAFNSYNEAIIIDTVNVNAYIKRGEINLQLNKLDDAIKDYKKAASENFDYYYFLGVLQERKGLLKDAESSIDSCLTYYPKSKMCRLKLDSLKLKISSRNNKMRF
ncbi:MAG: hypothetical protein JWQ63_2521 [Mucilaginibacter sp.]|nr:hypothetical protein [Mucilaginibacter sp.]